MTNSAMARQSAAIRMSVTAGLIVLSLATPRATHPKPAIGRLLCSFESTVKYFRVHATTKPPAIRKKAPINAFWEPPGVLCPPNSIPRSIKGAKAAKRVATLKIRRVLGVDVSIFIRGHKGVKSFVD